MPDASRQEPLVRRLVVRLDDGSEHDVTLEAPAGATVADVTAAIAEHLAIERPPLFAVADGLALDGSLLVAEAGLADAAVVALGRSASVPERPPEAVAFVCSGPASGEHFLLDEGEYLVGRGPSAALRLDDAALSAEHAWLRVGRGVAAVVDAGSTNGTAVEGTRLAPGAERLLGPDDVVQAGRTLLRVVVAPKQPAPVSASEGVVRFNRPPRVETGFAPARVVLPAAPERGAGPRVPIAVMIVPLVFGLVFYLTTRNPATLLFVLMTPVLAGWNYAEERIRGRRSHRREDAAYAEGRAAAEQQLASSVRAEEAWRRRVAPDPGEVVARALERRATLWERRPADADFGLLRLGSAEGRASVEVEAERSRDADDSVPDDALRLAHVPATVSLLTTPTIGLAGDRALTHAAARWLATQLAVLHSPRDLVLAAAIGSGAPQEWDFLKWLPHAAEADTTLRGPKLAVGANAAQALASEALALAAARREKLATRRVNERAGFRLVCLVVDEEASLPRDAVQELLSLEAELRIAVVWVGSDPLALPGGCAAVATLDAASGRVRVAGVEAPDGLLLEALPVSVARSVALALAPLRDAETGAAQGVPRRASLLATLDLPGLPQDVLAARWERRRRGGAQAAIGQAADGVVTIDLDADGPHALVAGTTGAGKSELLQTLVASLACDASPARLAFLLVDYKGGAAFKDCVALPHVAGLVTDLDEHLAVRALESLNAELRRRERILKEAGAKDLLELAERAPETAPPKLAIVIDEFAALAREIPDFVDGVVDIAQRGRSLGVHLVLATQRPAGAVNQNIRANTNIRIALRMADTNESNDVVDAPDAGRIPRDTPGRGYVRLGHSDLQEFQTAFAGTRVVAGAAVEEIRVADFALEERRAPTVMRTIHGGTTELRAVVEATAALAAEQGIERPAAPWVEPLPPLLPLEQLLDGERSDTRAPLGLADEPRLQRQRPFVVDLERDGNLLVYGAGGSGKSTLLRTLAASFASRAAPSELAVYGLDMGARGLRLLDALPHTGTIAPGDDGERVERLLRFVLAEIARRRELFAETGAYSLAELRAAGREAPRILLLVDGYEAFVQAYERVDMGRVVDALPRIAADGPAVGIHLALSAARRGSVPGALAGIVTQRVVLRMASEDEYGMLGVNPKLVRGLEVPPGRGFVEESVEAQLALVGDDPAGEAQAQALRALGTALAEGHPGERAQRVEPMATAVERVDLAQPEAPLHAPLGLDEDARTVQVALDERPFVVAGAYRSGRTTALATLAAGAGVPVHFLSARKAAPRETWASTTTGAAACAERLAELVASAPDGEELIVLDDADELTDFSATAALDELVRAIRGGSGYRLVVAVEKQALRRAYSGWLAELRKEQHGLVLAPDPAQDADLFQIPLPRSTGAFPPGRGFAVADGGARLLQVATD